MGCALLPRTPCTALAAPSLVCVLHSGWRAISKGFRVLRRLLSTSLCMTHTLSFSRDEYVASTSATACAVAFFSYCTRRLGGDFLFVRVPTRKTPRMAACQSNCRRYIYTCNVLLGVRTVLRTVLGRCVAISPAQGTRQVQRTLFIRGY